MNEPKADRYRRLERHAAILGTVLSVLTLVASLYTGGSAGLRNVAASLTGGSFTLTVVVYLLLLALVLEVIRLPLTFYRGARLERRYGLSTLSVVRWWADHARSGGVALVITLAAAALLWHAIRVMPEAWWMAASLCGGLVLAGLAHLAPVLLLPIFYDVKPLERPALEDRLVALAGRAGAGTLGVFEWRLSDRTRRANAAMFGVGRTRRILVSDTLLADHSDDEIEVILAHELGHHVHRDIWKTVALEVLVLVAACRAADLALEAAVPLLDLASKADVAGAPAVMLAGGGAALLLRPLTHALSRASERRADLFALEMTRNVRAFVTAVERLGVQNLAEERPSPIVEALFHSHPSVSARIAAAKEWSQAHHVPWTYD